MIIFQQTITQLIASFSDPLNERLTDCAIKMLNALPLGSTLKDPSMPCIHLRRADDVTTICYGATYIGTTGKFNAAAICAYHDMRRDGVPHESAKHEALNCSRKPDLLTLVERMKRDDASKPLGPLPSLPSLAPVAPVVEKPVAVVTEASASAMASSIGDIAPASNMYGPYRVQKARPIKSAAEFIGHLKAMVKLGGMYMVHVTLTPDVISDIVNLDKGLGKHNRNRNTKAHKAHIAALAQSMSAGHFKNCSMMHYDELGFADGQSRIVAALRAGVSISVTICIGFIGARQYANAVKVNTRANVNELDGDTSSSASTILSMSQFCVERDSDEQHPRSSLPNIADHKAKFGKRLKHWNSVADMALEGTGKWSVKAPALGAAMFEVEKKYGEDAANRVAAFVQVKSTGRTNLLGSMKKRKTDEGVQRLKAFKRLVEAAEAIATAKSSRSPSTPSMI
jgi:hypothetical protein